MHANAFDPFDGILLVNKPAGPTSHDVVDRIRRHFRFRKVGHGGTLDPQATGLLILLIGRGTRMSNRFMSSDKTYEGVFRLGFSTTTHDAEGEVVREADSTAVTREQLEAEMAKFRGDIYQAPPMVSAVKKDGVPLYKLARKGQTVERTSRLIHIYEFALRDFTPPRATFLMRCTKGTYVRTICHDVGEGLGCGAHLESLCRTQSGEYELKQAHTMDVILALDIRQLQEIVIPLHQIAGIAGLPQEP